jgi:hypothetical protein
MHLSDAPTHPETLPQRTRCAVLQCHSHCLARECPVKRGFTVKKKKKRLSNVEKICSTQKQAKNKNEAILTTTIEHAHDPDVLAPPARRTRCASAP